MPVAFTPWSFSSLPRLVLNDLLIKICRFTYFALVISARAAVAVPKCLQMIILLTIKAGT